jgi:hypothetical protein
VPPSWDLAATALVLTAEAAAALIADDADGGNSSVAIIGSTNCSTGNPTDASGVVATVDALDGTLPPGNTGEAQDDATITENDMSGLSGNISRGACLPFWRITCMLFSAVVVCCFDGQVA